MRLSKMGSSQFIRLALVALIAALLQSCATSGALHVARDQFRHGSTTAALETLANADISNRDRLLLYMDKGVIAQTSGDYRQSIEAFERAIALVEELDHVSFRDQTASIITTDRAARYKGEFSEQLWLHTFQMLNYLLLDDPTGAAVEARRAAALFEEHPKIFKHDKFTRMLMAASFENAGQYDSASVEYRKLANDFDYISPPKLPNDHGEVIAIVASGFIEPKLSGDLFIDYQSRISFPYYANRRTFKPSISVQVNGDNQSYSQTDTLLAQVSQRALEKRGRAVAVRQALRLAAKHNIAKSIEAKDELAGGVARLLLLAIEQADTRSWETLPSSISLVRIPVKTGPQTVSVQTSNNLYDNLGTSASHTLDVDLKEGQRLFTLIRTDISEP